MVESVHRSSARSSGDGDEPAWLNSVHPDAATPRKHLVLILKPKRRNGTVLPTSPRAITAALEEMNAQFSVVLMGSDVRILALANALGEPHRQIKIGSFHTAYATIRYINEESASKPLTGLWINHANRRTHFNVTFNPKRGALTDADTLNLWNDFAVAPKKGDWSLLRKHIYEVVCQRNIVWFTWLMCWIADIIQCPERKPGTAVVVRGLKGVGKTIVAEYISKLMPHNSLSLSKQGQLLGRFNDHLAGKLFVTVEEAVWAGSKEGESVMKDMITAPKQAIETKGLSIIFVDDFLRLWYSTNSEWAVPATWDERRFFVLHASDEHKEDPVWFGAIHKQMKHGGLEAMMYDLLKLFPPRWVSLRKPPKTPYLGEQVERSLPSVDQWWHSVLADGAIIADSARHCWPVPGDTADPVIDAIERNIGGVRSDQPAGSQGGLCVPIDHVWSAYQRWCQENKERYPITKSQVGKFMVGVVGAGKSRPRIPGDRLNVYNLAPLSELRDAFATKYGIDFEGPLTTDDIETWGTEMAEELEGYSTWSARWEEYAAGGEVVT